MSDYIETPSIATLWCPRCDPERDPVAEVLATQYCPAHPLEALGSEDAAVPGREYYVSHGGSEGGGEDNRRWCELFHRSRE